ncbi:MAG: DNA-binding protein [Chloroflexi bacterium]|nr:DNA-binding protein [Chloroflexota bacterium]
MKIHVFRLHPGQDLKLEIDKFTEEHNIKDSAIVSCVGALTKATIRMAGARKINTYEDDFEIVSLVGTAENGYSHLHIAISNEEGKTIGGHLKSPSIVGTTAEVVIGEIEDLSFEREFDEDTGCKELVIKKS